VSGPSKPDAAPHAGGDPSMEDILASIRRILSEEEAPPATETAADADVLVLDESMLAPAEPAAVAAIAPPAPELPSAAAEPVAAAPPAVAPVLPALPPSAIADDTAEPSLAEPVLAESSADLVAPEAAAAAAASVAGLLRTLASDRALQVHAGGPTIEDIVRQTLRPLLKEWLDANLPALVERLVRAEIERVVNRAVP
jgi:cell pole-organizing protein PopZ